MQSLMEFIEEEEEEHAITDFDTEQDRDTELNDTDDFNDFDVEEAEEAHEYQEKLWEQEKEEGILISEISFSAICCLSPVCLFDREGGEEELELVVEAEEEEVVTDLVEGKTEGRWVVIGEDIQDDEGGGRREGRMEEEDEKGGHVLDTVMRRSPPLSYPLVPSPLHAEAHTYAYTHTHAHTLPPMSPLLQPTAAQVKPTAKPPSRFEILKRHHDKGWVFKTKDHGLKEDKS